jgi:hypothetical protein
VSQFGSVFWFREAEDSGDNDFPSGWEAGPDDGEFGIQVHDQLRIGWVMNELIGNAEQFPLTAWIGEGGWLVHVVVDLAGFAVRVIHLDSVFGAAELTGP